MFDSHSNNKRQLNNRYFAPIDPDSTVNTCNQFLLVKLINKIKSFQARNLNDLTFTYKKACSSIKRYPLPIICRAQLQSINGIGDKLCDELEKTIKVHYKAYFDRNMQQKDPNYGSQNISTETIQSSMQFSRFQKLDQDSNVNGDGYESFNCSANDDTKTLKSAVVGYKPRVNTVNANFLLSLNKILKSDESKYAQKGVPQKDILQYMEANFTTVKKKALRVIQNVLETNGYITIITFQSESNLNVKGVGKTSFQDKFYKLTEKGQLNTEALNEKTKIAQSKHRIVNQVKIFKSQLNLNTNIKDMENLHSNHFQNKIEQTQGSKITLRDLFNEQQLTSNLENEASQAPVLQLIIDSRQRKEKTESCYFLDKISKNHNIPCRITNLPIGDFLWVYGNKVLNYIVERKKADDLASSILDGRYKDQKFRLKNCGLQNVFYLFEGHPSDKCAKTQRQLNNALLKTRVKQNFKVIQTKNVTQSMKCLYSIHKQIQESIQKKTMKCFGTLDQFCQYNSTQKNLTVGSLFGLGLMTIPGLGKSGISIITKFFKTYYTMHQYLSKLHDNFERIQFLKKLFQGKGINSTVPTILINLLFNSPNDKHKQKPSLTQLNIGYEIQQQVSKPYNDHSINSSQSQSSEQVNLTSTVLMTSGMKHKGPKQNDVIESIDFIMMEQQTYDHRFCDENKQQYKQNIENQIKIEMQMQRQIETEANFTDTEQKQKSHISVNSQGTRISDYSYKVE